MKANKWTGVEFGKRVEEIVKSGTEKEAAKLQARAEEKAAMRKSYDGMIENSTLQRFTGMRDVVGVNGDVTRKASATWRANKQCTAAESIAAIQAKIDKLKASTSEDADKNARNASRVRFLQSKVRELNAPRVNGVKAIAPRPANERPRKQVNA